MAENRSELIELKAQSGVGEGCLRSIAYSSGERTGRALKVLLICWVSAGLAFVTFVPIVHLVLSISLFIAGPVLAYSRQKLALAAESAEGTCPECGDEITIKLEPNDSIPKWTYCPACNKPLQLVYHSAPSE